MTTYGEYIKTPAAKAESDAEIRKHINMYLKDGWKLEKYKVGVQGTLDYGKAVIMFRFPTAPATKKLIPKIKDAYLVIKVDHGLSHYSGFTEQKVYRLKSAAEKRYLGWTKMHCGV
jgi:hypothetical protein